MEKIMEPQDTSLADGEYNVVDSMCLQGATAGGARLVRILMVDMPQTEFVHGHSGPNGMWVPERNEFKGTCTTPKFVIFTPREAVSRRQEQERQQLETELRTTQDAMKQLQSERVTQAGAVNDLKEQVGRYNKAISDQREQLSTARERAGKMEQDVAKLRQALGEIEMKRILGA